MNFADRFSFQLAFLRTMASVMGEDDLAVLHRVALAAWQDRLTLTDLEALEKLYAKFDTSKKELL